MIHFFSIIYLATTEACYNPRNPDIGMRSSTRHVFIFTFALLFSNVVATPTLVGAQIQSPSNANATDAHKMGVKVTSPSANTTVPAGQLTIHGISSDTPNTNCKVYVDWNDVKPMQNVTAKGPGGVNDYSNWTYTYNEKYHIISPGINELTSKITCFDNPSNITSKHYSVNITGLKNNTIPFTLPSSGNTTLGFHNAVYLPQYSGFYHNIFQPSVKNESLVQDSSNDNSPDDNNDGTEESNNNDNSHDNSHHDDTNDDNIKNHDSQSQSNSHAGDDNDDNDDSSNNSSGNDSHNKHSGETIHNAKDNDNKEHREKNTKTIIMKNNEAHSNNLKVHKQKH